MRKVREVRPLQGQYTWRQLLLWYDQLRDAGIWDVAGMSMSDVNEGTNRIEFWLACESDRDRGEREVGAVALSANVPVEAVVVRVGGGAQYPESPHRFQCAPPEFIDPITGVSSPGFGGMFYESRILNIHMLDPSQKEAEDLAFTLVGRDILEHPQLGPNEIRALEGQYTWEQLLEWYETITGSGFAIIGVQSYDVRPDPTRNRLRIEIDRDRNRNVESEVEELLKQLGVPREAVVLVE